MLKEVVKKLMTGTDLSAEDMRIAMTHLMENSNEVEAATFLTALSLKGETAAELYGAVMALQERMIKVAVAYPVLDIVGTGGDGFNTVNISTAASLLAASCGVKVAKHGNRAASSMSGSADVLEALGMHILLTAEEVQHCIDLYNFGFCYAPQFHPALGRFKAIRKQMTIPTVFNLIGPLLNPCNAEILMIGVSQEKYLNLFSQVLLKMAVPRAVVFTCIGIDELCCVAPINVIEIIEGHSKRTILDPADYGFSYCRVKALQGGCADVNAKMIQAALAGEVSAVADSLILTAGVANYLYGITSTIAEGVTIAQEKQRQGAAYILLQQLIATTQSMRNVQEAYHA